MNITKCKIIDRCLIEVHTKTDEGVFMQFLRVDVIYKCYAINNKLRLFSSDEVNTFYDIDFNTEDECLKLYQDLMDCIRVNLIEYSNYLS